MNSNEALGYINSQEQGRVRGCWTPVFSHWDTTAANQRPCSLSRVNSLRVTEGKGPKGGVGPQSWTTTHGRQEHTEMVEEWGRNRGRNHGRKRATGAL